MSPPEDYTKWLKRGRQRSAIVRVLRKPMTASEICQAAKPINPHLRLRDVWFIMPQLGERGLAVCLNSRQTTGKLYCLTSLGLKLAADAFGESMTGTPPGVDWRKYARVVRARVRKCVLLELARMPAGTAATASKVRKSLRERQPVGLNPAIRALKELERLGLVRSTTSSGTDARRSYSLTKAGLAITHAMQG